MIAPYKSRTQLTPPTQSDNRQNISYCRTLD